MVRYKTVVMHESRARSGANARQAWEIVSTSVSELSFPTPTAPPQVVSSSMIRHETLPRRPRNTQVDTEKCLFGQSVFEVSPFRS